MPTAEILSQGHEVVTGQVADTNAAWLSTQLVDLGFQVHRHGTVGDDLDDIVALLKEGASRSDVCICTGGLGPTEDDLTAEAVARAFDRPLEPDEEAMRQIESMYQRYRRPMPEVNRKQAWLPRGAVRLDNHWGTAPGFAIRTDRGWMFFVPGVPREMRQMWQHRIRDNLISEFALSPGTLVTLRCTGIGESNLQERVGSVKGATVSYRTRLPENHLKLLFSGGVEKSHRERVVAEVAARIGSALFTIEGADGVADAVRPGLDGVGGTLFEVVGRRLTERSQTVSVAESCTGGRIASAFTGVSGASGWFTEGVVTYSNEAKVRLLGVDASAIEAHGAVSEPVVRQMAEGSRTRSGCTWALATSGIAGPSGGTPDKPVGTVHLALAGPAGTVHRLVHSAGGRQRVQDLAVGTAVDMLRRALEDES